MTKYKSSQSFGGDKRREKNLLRKAVLTFLMTGVIAWPSFSPTYAAPLDGVVRSDGGVTKINGNVGDYYVGKQSGAVGVNVFEKFDVKQSEIANMQFHNREKTYTATHLLNFVKDRINIDGTVNGIRNNRIGGNMYFISSNGMLVGEKGAINAGALTVMAPQERFIYKAFTALEDGATNTATDVLKGMITGDIPLNPSGSIVINGTVRTGVESRFMAANIVVGKDLETNEKGEPVYNDDGTLKVSGDYQARIINGVDFSNIVNTKGIEGFDYALPADFDTDTAGKYRLKLKKEVVEETGEDGEKKKKDVYYLVDSHQGIRSDGTVTLQANLGIEKLSAETVTGSADIKTNIEVGKAAVIDSAGSVNITATADASPSGIDLPLVLAFLNAKANVGVNGTIKAGHNVDINANATSVGMHSGPRDLKVELIMKVLTEGLGAFNPAYYAGYSIDAFKENLFPFLMNNPIAFVKATAKADVKVSGTAKVTATDDITVQGMSTVVGAAMRSVTPNTTYDVLGGQHPYENINFAMVNLDSTSNVDIEGDLTAGGTVQAMAISAANATTMPTIAANNHKVGESYSGYANAAVGIDIVKNNAKLTIGKDANIDAGGAAVLGAVTDTGGTNQIAMSTDQRAAFNTGVGYVQMDGNANTDIKGSVNSGGLVNIMANANVSSNINSVNNASKLAEVLNYGTTEWRLPPEAFKILVPEDKQVNFLFLQELFKFMGQIGKNGADEPVIGAGNPPSRPNFFDKLDFGASVAITKIKNNAKVEVGKEAKVYAMGPDLQTTKDANKITSALTIAADASVAPISISTNSNMTDTARMEGQAVSAALSASVEDIVNNADVVIDARDGKTTAQKIDGKEPIYLPAADIYAPKGTVTINSTTLVGGYKPISWFNNVKDIFVGNKEKGIKSLPEQFKYFGIAIGDVFTHGKKVTQEFERVFGITAEGDWNVVNDTNYNTYDGSLYMDDVIARLQQVEQNTGNGMSEMANEFKGDYQKCFNEAYDLLKSEKKFIDHDSRDYTTDGEAGKGGKVVDLAFKAPVQHNPADLIMTVFNLIVEIPKAFDPVGLGTNIAATAQSGKDADPDHNSLSFSGAATYFHSDSSANTVIGRNVQIEAGRADIGANEKQIAINVLTGKKSLSIFKVPTPYDTSGRFAIGGNVAVNSIENDAVVLVSEGAEIRTKNTTGDPSPYALPYHKATVLNSYQMGEDEKKGVVITIEDIQKKYSSTHKGSGNVDVNSISNDVDIAAVLGGGKAMKLGLTGMAAVMKGHNYSYVGVDDEARLIAEKIITMQGINKSVLASAVVDLTKASGIGIGASVGVMDFGIDNLVMVADNDIQDVSADGKTITLPSDEANPRKDREAADFIKRLNMVLGADYAQAGRTGTTLTDGEIDADSLTLDAKTSGFRLNITLTGTETDARWENVQSSTVPEVGIAGSVSVNDFVSRTDAVLETPKLALHAPTATVDAGHLKINAADSGFIGAISGAAAVAFHITQSGDANPGARLAGAVALNNITRDTVTEVWGTKIVNAVEVENFADSTGTQVAAGLSAGLSMEERSEQEIDASASVSKNTVKNNAKAILKKVNTENAVNAVVNNIAAAKDIQVAGGLNLDMAGNDFACFGVTTAFNNITNTIEAKIEDGTYNVRNLNNYANSQLKQVAGAVAVGLQLKEAGKFTGQGAGATNTINNTVQSISRNASITANKVDMLAWDGLLTLSDQKNIYTQYLQNRGFDINGEWTLSLANSTAGDVDMDVKDDPSGDTTNPPSVEYKTKKFTDGGKKGNTMVSFAVVAPIDVSGEGKIVKALAGVVKNTLTNKFDTQISGGSITAKASDGSNALSAQAKADSRLVAVAAGVAVGTGASAPVQAAGSVVVNNVKDTVGALVQNSTLKSDKTYIYANDLTHIVGVSGALGAYKSGAGSIASGGLTWAQGTLNNLTSAKMLGTNLNAYNSAKKADLTVNAVNDFTIHSIAAEVNANFTFTPGLGELAVLRGAYAFNQGTNSIEALVDKTADKASVIANGGNITVNTNDTSTEKAIAVAVGLDGGKMSGGVHIAKSYIGEEDATKHQHNFAKIQNTAITLAGVDSALKVEALDNSKLTTIAVGGGFDKDGLIGLNGSAAKAKNYKDVEAAVSLSNISVKNNLTASKMEVLANNTMKMTTSADGASISKESSIVGAAGVATNDSIMTTKAYVNGNNNTAFKAGSVDVMATSDNTLTNVGISLCADLKLDPSVLSFTLDALANVAKNNLKNDTIALVENFKVDADKTVTVKSKSEEKITNVVGAANVQIGTGANMALNFGFGASVAVNTITGSTTADLLNSDIKVGNGLYVNADALHKNKNVVFSGGLAISKSDVGNVSLSANAVVSVNEISGETKARLYKTDANKGVTGSQAAVEVTAKDEIKLDSTTADAQLHIAKSPALNIDVVLGAGVLMEDNNRNTKALAAGESGNISTINAKTFKVDATATQMDNVVNACAGLSLAITPGALAELLKGKPPINGSGAASVATTHVDLKGITLAQVDYVNTDNQGMTVNAFHKDTVDALGVAASGSVALFGLTTGVSVYKFTDDSKTISLLQNGTVTHDKGTVKSDEITAKNESKLTSREYTIAAGLNLGIAGGVAIWNNKFNSSVLAKVDKTNIGTSAKRGELIVKADTDVTEKFNSVGVDVSVIAFGVNKVRNTLNTTTNAEVTGSNNTIYADNVYVKANENRNVTDKILQVTLGGLEVAVSDIVTNIGFVGNGIYVVTYSDKVTEATIDNPNENLGENNSKTVTDARIADAEAAEKASREILLNSLNNNKLKNNSHYDGWSDIGPLGGLQQKTTDIPTSATFTSGVHTKVAGVTLDSAGIADFDTTIKNNITSTSGSYPMVAALGVDVLKNFVTLQQNNSVDIANAKIKAGNVFIGNVIEGEVKVHSEDARLVQGLTVTVVKSSATRKGGTKVNVENSDLIGLSEQVFRNLDTLKLDAEVISVGGSVLTGAYLKAETVDNSTMKMNIGVSATDKSSSLYSNGNITFENVLAPQLDSEISYGGGKIASGQGTLATAWLGNENETSADKTISLDVSDTSIFANNVQVTNGLSDNNGHQAKLTVDENVTSVSALEIAVNKGRTTSVVNTSTNFSNIKSNASLANAYRTANGLTGVAGVADWHVFANNALDIFNKLKNADVGIGICTGTNYTRNYAKNTTVLGFTVAEGTNFEAKVLEIKANSAGNGTVHSRANDGGVLAVSPVAAGVKNEMTFNTSVSIGGNFVVTGKADIQSSHSSDLNLFADGHCGNIVGGSGVKVNNNVVVNNSTNLNAANITTGDTLTVKTNTMFDLNKKFNVEEGTPDDFMLYASNKGGLADGCGSYLTNVITINNKTNITNSSLQSKGNLVIGSYGDHHIYVTQSGVSSSIAVGASNSRVNNTINETDEVNINQDSGKTTELLTLDKNADIYLVATDITDASAKCFSEHTFSILFAGAGAHLTDKITRNNKINVNGGTVFSYKGVNLFTNLDENNVLGKMLLQESSRTFTSGAITIPYSNINSTLNQNNQVTVGSDAEVYSVGDVNIYADKGAETINRKSGSYCWYKNNQKDEFTTTSNGTTNSKVTRNNFADIKGKVTAGILNNFEIYIGKEGQGPIIIVPDEGTKTAYFDGAGNSAPIYTADQYEQYISFGFKGTPEEIAAQEEALFRLTGIKKEQLKPELVDVSGGADTRLNEIQKLLGEYSSDGQNSAAYKALKAEEQRLIGEMERRGLAGGALGGAQRVSQNMRIKVPDITVGGGNVNIETDTLKGNGTITANGMQEVKITNNSSTLLEVHNISVAKAGGQVTFNGKVMPKENYQAEIKKLNVDKAVGDSNIPTLITQASGIPTISVRGLWSGSNVKYKSFTVEGQTMPAGSLILPADVYILGTVENLAGNVFIESAYNNIVVNSNKDSGIRGANITLKAEQGGIVQLAPESTINIGQSPEIAYRKFYDDFVSAYKTEAGKKVLAALREEGDLDSELRNYERAKTKITGVEAYALGIVNEEDKDAYYVTIDFGFQIPKVIIYKNGTETVQWNSRRVQFSRENDKNKRNVQLKLDNPPSITRNDGDRITSGSAGYIAGDRIFIQGRDINIDGIIQSGYGEYRLNLTAADEGVINSIKQRYSGGVLTDAQVLNNSAYCIREGGAAWDSASQSYRYEMAAYYNPSTDTVVVPTVNSRGGDIYLTGRIVSTGNGLIKCLDGVSTININNTYNHNLSVNNLTVSDVQGRVTIVDDGLMRNVSIYRNSVTPGNYEGATSATGHISGGNSHYSYQPKSGLSYEWLSGEQQNTIKTYEGKKRATWWGWSKYKDYDPQKVISEAEDTHQIGESPAELRPRTEGNYITEEATTQNEFLKITRTYTHVAGVKTLSGPPTPSTTGYLGCHKWLTFQWTEKNGYTYTNEARVKADYPIKIDFIGTTADKGVININNIGNVAQDKVVTINGDVGNTQLYNTGIEKGRVNIQSNGAIKQVSGSIYGQTVDLTANGNLENIKITAGNIVNLDAWSTAAGSSVKVDVTAQGNATGKVNLGALGGNNISLANLTAQGDILRATNAVNTSHNNGVSLVKADRIDLVSKNGAIGTAGNVLYVNGGQIADTNNSMSASVNADAKNSIYLQQITGNLRVGKIASHEGDLVIEVPGGGIVDAQMAVATPESEITTKKDLITEWASIGVIDDGSKIAKKQIAMKNEQLSREREVLIIERDAEGTTAERKAQINKQLAELPAEYTPWNADQLLYALQASIFNPEAGVNASPKDPNLYGKSITLKVTNNVGILSDDVKTISTVGLYDQNPDKSYKRLDDIRAISWADPGTTKYDKDKKEITIVNKIAIGVQHQNGGGLTVTDWNGSDYVNGYVYVEGRDLHNTDIQNRDIDISQIKAEGDIRLTSLGNLTTAYSAPATGPAIVTKGDLFLSVGDATNDSGYSLGSEANPFFVQAAGNVQVLATGDIYLKSLGDLNVLDIVAGRKGNTNGGKIYLEALKNNDIAKSGNIYGVVVPNQDIQGYIRSDGNKSITLKADCNIGSWDNKSKTVRIKNADETTADNKVNLSAETEIVVEGVSTAPVTGEQQTPQGVFSVQSIGGFLDNWNPRISITVNGTLIMAGNVLLNVSAPYSTSEITLKADKLKFDGGSVRANTINLQSVTSLEQGEGTLIKGMNVNLTAGKELDKFTYGTTMLVDAKDLANARVTQKYENKINETTGERIIGNDAKLVAYNLNVISNADIDLGSQKNKIFNITADAQKSIQIASGSLKEAGLNHDENVDITATIRNSHDPKGKVHGDISLMVYDTDTIKNNLYGKGDFLATGDIMFYDEAGNLDLHNDGGVIRADGMVVLMANTDLNAGKLIKAGKGLGIIAKEDITALPDFAWVDGGGFYVESLEGNIKSSVFAGMVGSKDAGGNITYVNGSIKMIAEKGSINNMGSLAMYAHDDVELRAKTNITNDAGIYSENGNIEIYTLGEGTGEGTGEGEIINNNELVTKNGYVLLYGNKGVTNKASIYAESVGEGDSDYREDAGRVTILSNTKIVNAGDDDEGQEIIWSARGVNLEAGKEGLINSADIYVEKGDVMLYGTGEYKGMGMEYLDPNATGGSVDNSGGIYTKEGFINLNAEGHLNNTGYGSIHTGKGDVILCAGTDLNNQKDIYTEQGNLEIRAGGNVVNSTGNLVALGNGETEGNLAIISEGGNITYAMHANGSGNGGVAINGEYFGFSTGKLTMKATAEGEDKGKIEINSSLVSGRGISITADKKIAIGEDYEEYSIRTLDGDVDITSNHGQLDLQADITAYALDGDGKGNVTLKGKGYIKTTGFIDVVNGDFMATATAFDSVIASAPDSLLDDQKGYITIGKDAATDKLQVSNGKITMTADDKITLETQAKAKFGFTATAGSDFITTNAADLRVDNGDIIVNADRNIDNAGTIETAAGNVIMQAKTGTFTNTSATWGIRTTQGFIGLSSGSDMTNSGVIQNGKGDIDLSAAGGLTNTGEIRSNTIGDIVVTADSDVDNSVGKIYAKTGSIIVTANNGAVSNDIMRTDDGNIAIRAGHGNVTSTNLIQTLDGKITIDAVGNVYNGNGGFIRTDSTGDITVNATGILDNSNGSIRTTTGNIDLTVGGDVTSKFINTTTGRIIVTSQGAITNSDKICTDETGDIILTAGKGISDTTGIISTKLGDITLSANDGNVVVNKVTVETGDISVTANKEPGIGDTASNGDVTNKTEIVTTNGKITVKATGNVDNSTGKISTKAVNSTISTAETGNITINAGGKVDNSTGSIIAENMGNITVTAGATVDSSSGKISVATIGDIMVIAAAAVDSSNGTISTNKGQIDVIGHGITSNIIKTTNGGITVTSQDIITNNGSISTAETGDIVLKATGDITSKDITTKVGQIAVNSEANIISNGNITSMDEGSIILIAGNGISAETGIISTNLGNVTLTANNGDVVSNIVRTDTGDISVTANKEPGIGDTASNGDVTNKTEIVTTNGKITVKAAGNVDNRGSISTNVNNSTSTISEVGTGNIVITAGGNIDNSIGLISTVEGEIELKADGNITSKTINTKEGRITVTSQGIITNSGSIITAETGDVVLKATGNITSKDITTNVGQILVDSGANITSNSGINSWVEGDVVLNAGNSITAETATISTNKGDIILTANDGNVVSNRVIAETGDISVAAKGTDKGDVTNKTEIAATYGKITVNAAGNLDNSNGQISTVEGDIYLKAGGSVTSKTLGTTKGGIIVTSEGIITNSGSISTAETGDVVLMAKGNVTSNDIRTKVGKVLVKSQGDIIISGGEITSSSEGYIELNAGNGISAATGSISTKVGDIILTANDGSVVSNNVVVETGDISVAAEGKEKNSETKGGVISKTVMTTTEKGNIVVTAAGILDNSTGQISTVKGEVDLKAGGDITSKTVKTGTGNITVKGGADVTSSMEISATVAGEIYVTADQVLTNNGLISTVEGAVFMDSQADLINTGSIYVDNADIIETVGCDVTLHATGNVYSTGSVYVGGNGNVLLNADSLNADGTVKTSTVGNGAEQITYKGICNTGDVYAVKGDVTFEATNGDIYNSNTLTSDSATYSNGSITMKAVKGSIVNTKTLYAANDIWMESMGDIYNLSEDDTTTSTIAGESVMRGLTTTNGSITLISYGNRDGQQGLVVNKGLLQVANGDLTISAYGSKKLSDAISAFAGTDLAEESFSFLNDKEGDAYVTNGEINITTTRSVITLGDMEARKGARDNSGNIALISTEGNVLVYSVDEDYNHDIEAHAFIAERDMRFHAAQGYVYSDKGFISEGDMVLEYGSGEQDLGEIKSKTGNVSITSNFDGGLTINASVTAAKDIEILASEGELIISHDDGNPGYLNAGEDIILMATKNVTIVDAGDVVTAAGGISINSYEKNVHVEKGELKAEKDIGITAKNLVDLTCDITSTTGAVAVASQGGNILINGNIESAKDVGIVSAKETKKLFRALKNAPVTETTGNIEMHGNITSGNDVIMKTVTGTISYSGGNITAKNDINIYGQKTVDIDGNVVANAGGINVQSATDDVIRNGYTEGGKQITVLAGRNVNVTGSMSAKQDIQVNAQRDIRFDSSDIKTEGGGIEIQSNTGDITIEPGLITAEKFVRIYTKGNSTDERSLNGDEYYRGVKQDPSGEGSQGNIFAKADIITNGDVDLSAYDGQIATGNITAGKMAAVGTHGGQIKVGKMKGNSVTLYTESENSDIDFKSINVRDKLILAGNNLTLDMSNVIFDKDGCEVYIYGVGGKLQGNIFLDFTGCIDMDKLYIRQLNVGRAVIKANAPIIIDNLNVADRAEFYTWGTKTDVYGRVQDYDKDAQVIYYHKGKGDAAIDLSPVFFGYNLEKKQENIDILSANPRYYEIGGQGIGAIADAGKERKGMQLEILSRTVQKSGSILLKDARDYSVYGQRYSVESLMQDLLSIKIDNVFNSIFNNDIHFFKRFNNVDIPDVVVNQPEEWDKDSFEF